MKFLLTLSLLFVAFNSSAVVKRHDVAPEMYQLDEVPEVYVDMPFQGGAVLIDKHWLLAPAHVIYTFMYDYEGKPIMVHGVENQIAEIILHPDYSRFGGESAESKGLSLFEQLNNNKDIALIRLASLVSHIKPIAIYAGDDERYTFGKYGSTAVLTRVSYFQAWISNYIEDIEFVSK